MATASHSSAAKPPALPPYQELAQREFMARFGKALTEHVAQAVPPIYTGPQDTPWAPLSLLEARKPLGAQGLIAQAGAAAIRGLRHSTNRPGRPPLRGLILVAEMATGKVRRIGGRD